MGYVFISHSSSDKVLVDRVCRELGKAQHKAWIDVEAITVGSDWREAIDNALRSAESVIVILSTKSIKSEYVTYEWSFAFGAGIPVIPVLIENVKPHPRLYALQHIDFRNRCKWGQLIESIRNPSRQAIDCTRDAVTPVIYAEFELLSGKPALIGNSYRLLISTRDVPNGTRRVDYKIHDKTFPKRERRFYVDCDQNNFMDWINSYGDLFLSARGTNSDSVWRTQSTLAEALRRRYGVRPAAPILQAIATIESN